MIEIHLYGKLRSMVSNSKASEDTIMKLEYVEGETFEQFVVRLGLKPEDLGDCFINGNLAKKNHQLSDGDRIGLFPFNMVLLCGGQHLKGHGYTKEDVDVDYY
jgi:molybdopterin converting factor small subunit